MGTKETTTSPQPSPKETEVTQTSEELTAREHAPLSEAEAEAETQDALGITARNIFESYPNVQELYLAGGFFFFNEADAQAHAQSCADKTIQKQTR